MPKELTGKELGEFINSFSSFRRAADKKSEKESLEIKTRRFGRFYVSLYLVDSGEIAPILAKMRFIPWRVEAKKHRTYHGSEFEFIGTSSYFRELNPGFLIPEYTITPYYTTERFGKALVDVSIQEHQPSREIWQPFIV